MMWARDIKKRPKREDRMKYILIFILLFPSSLNAAWQSTDKKTPDESVNINTYSGEAIKAYLWYPENFQAEKANKKYKAVVMAHGCGGAHYKDESDKWTAPYVAGKYKVWGKLLNEQDIVVMLVDSFSTRDDNGDVGGGVCDTSDPLDRPDKIDPVSVRPADIAAGISYIKSRSDFQTDKVGVFGFSNGGTSTLVLANHENLIERSNALKESGKKWFDLPFNEAYRADLFVALYPGCGLNGYSAATRDIFNDLFLTYTDTFLYIASDDTSLPANTKEKCQSLRLLDAEKTFDSPNMKMKVVVNTDHQFDYYEADEQPVKETIERILALFESM